MSFAGSNLLDTNIYVTFWVADHHCAIDAREVEEVLLAPQITEVPLAPPELQGLIHLRGQIIPALDTGAICGFALDADTSCNASIIVTTDDGSVGLQVQKIGDVLEVTPQNHEPIPLSLPDQLRRTLKGIYRWNQGILLDLNPKSFGAAVVPARRPNRK